MRIEAEESLLAYATKRVALVVAWASLLFLRMEDRKDAARRMQGCGVGDSGITGRITITREPNHRLS